MHSAKSLIELTGLFSTDPETICITSTSRLDQLVKIIEELKRRFPDAEICVLVQNGRRNFVDSLPGYIKVIEVFPDGMLNISNIRRIRLDKIRELKPDLYVVPYNNKYGDGYLMHASLAVYVKPKIAVGVYFDTLGSSASKHEILSAMHIIKQEIIRAPLLFAELVLVVAAATLFLAMLAKNIVFATFAKYYRKYL